MGDFNLRILPRKTAVRKKHVGALPGSDAFLKFIAGAS